MNLKILGGVLLILGTSIGAGMLALPVASAYENILVTALMLITSWAVMTLGAFSLLEVNIHFPGGSNIISMAKQTLGKTGEMFGWLSYLLLMYSLLCAYIAGGADIVHVILLGLHWPTPDWLDAIFVVLILGFIVYRGIYSVDVINRGLMSVKMIIYVFLAVVISPYIKLDHLSLMHNEFRMSTLMVMITSFGYAIIVPSLRAYFQGDVSSLKKVVLIGSLLPLVIYLIWIVLIQGLIPRLGDHGLLNIAHSGRATSGLMFSIDHMIHSGFISTFANIFVSICAITSFLGVALSLADFIADGIGRKKEGANKVLIHALTFLPPLLVVVFFPGIFITALGYAGIFCVFLLIILPIMMSLRLRVIKSDMIYRTPFNKWILLIGLLFSLGIFIYLIFEKILLI